ncbi:hypothetical protein CIB84_001869, partial [Bambusicola thoracicus]
PHTLSIQDLGLELCALDFSFVSPQTALLQLHQATHSHSSQLGDDRHKAGTGSVIPSLLSQTGPKINASEGINRREKKAWTLGGQDCFVFPKAISLFTRRLLFQKNTGPVTLPRSVGAQQSREHSRQTWFGKGAYLLPLKERREEERNLHCSAISTLSTGFEHAPVWQQKAASIYLRWQRGPSTVAVSLACWLGKRAVLLQLCS